RRLYPSIDSDGPQADQLRRSAALLTSVPSLEQSCSKSSSCATGGTATCWVREGKTNMTTWNIDTSHSGVHFAVRHMVVTKVRGAFTRWQGTIDFDEQNPEASKVSLRIEAASIDTREPQRDAHLRSADFFDVERFPTLSFESTKVEKLKGNNC